MRKTILVYSVAIILISVAVTASVSVAITVNSFIAEKQRTLLGYAELISGQALAERQRQDAAEFPATLSALAERIAAQTGYRVTFIDEDGTPLADSQAGPYYVNMDNHRDREEVTAALKTGRGTGRRQSSTFGREFIYAAARGTTGDGRLLITRLALEVNSRSIALRHMVETALLSALIGVILGSVIAIFYTRRLTAPVRALRAEMTRLLQEYRRAEDLRREFVANVTHELKTPLTSISGFAETLQGSAGADPAVRGRFLDIISAEAARLGRLIDDILTLSAIERQEDALPAGSGDTEGSGAADGDVNVRQALEEVLATLQPRADECGIALHFQAQYEIYIGGDSDRFKQMLLNLIENAIKYSGSGKNVWIRAEKESAGAAEDWRQRAGLIVPAPRPLPAECVLVSVRDEGIGIAAADLPRLFERFYRVDKSHSRAAGGTGLGLAIVKHIAAIFGAELLVASAPGQGSTFALRLPN